MELDEPQAPPISDLSVPDSSDVKIWATKGVHFWTLLGAILLKVRPDSILELGGGRSTTVLADYAFAPGSAAFPSSSPTCGSARS
jgi:hypothetical protein